jgi:pyruvate,water dikinase
MMQFMRGLPYNVTTEMDLHLWETARAIRKDSESWQVFQQNSAQELARLFQLQKLPPASQNAVGKFMRHYGMRGVGEIDIGRKRWREDSTPLMQVLGSYLQIEDEGKAPNVIFRQGAVAAEKALAEAEEAIRKTHGGWLRARIFRWAIGRARRLLGLRESPKFFIIRIMGVVRQAMIDSGRELAAAGILYDPLDVFLLRMDELEAMARGEERDWKAAVRANRANQEREGRRKQIPVLLLSDGRAFYPTSPAHAQAGQDILAGSPVSPGMVEGRVRIVLSPQHAGLQPGEIMVCPGTDPAWTPLFLAAGGLIMEVGGMMTHGAVVAREYGIPAVVGVAQATQRLQTGQLVRLDGSSGLVTVLDDHGDGI